jgi:transitional endoplasmic reticulum ATPase
MKSHFASTYRPIDKSDIFTVSAGIRSAEFQIIECEPGERCSVTRSTEIYTEGQPLERKDDDKPDISGCRRQPPVLRESVCR